MITMGLGAGTLAYFSDTEAAVDNTFTAGTIDISVDGQNPWTNTYKVRVDGDCSDAPDLKPSQVGYIRFPVENVGTNPLDLYKKVWNIDDTTGIETYKCTGIGAAVSSEPECEAAVANGGDANDISNWIFFDLKVNDKVLIKDGVLTVGKGATAPGATGSVEGQWMYLGRLQPGEAMKVEQSFHLYFSTSNLYQGDVMTFDETLLAYQCEGYIPTPPGGVMVFP